MKKLLFIFLIILSLNSFADVHWNKPVFDNFTLMNVSYIEISTIAQGKKHIAKFGIKGDNQNFILPFENIKLDGILGGDFKNDDPKANHNTTWTIYIEADNTFGHKYTLTGKENYCNIYSSGPALSFWPSIRFLCTDLSKLTLSNDHTDSSYKLRVQIYPKNSSESVIDYNIRLSTKIHKDNSIITSL
jgi:hypothetical protein